MSVLNQNESSSDDENEESPEKQTSSEEETDVSFRVTRVTRRCFCERQEDDSFHVVRSKHIPKHLLTLKETEQAEEKAK